MAYSLTFMAYKVGVPKSMRLDPDLWKALDAMAEADQRTTTSLVRKVLCDWLNAQGQQPPQAAE